MREIKFRIWNSPDNNMSYDFKNFRKTNKKHILSQYIGLKDKCKKNIYEGDILKINDNNVLGVVTYNEEHAGFFLKMPDNVLGESTFCKFDYTLADNVEIIGNIYQHRYIVENKPNPDKSAKIIKNTKITKINKNIKNYGKY